MYGTTSKFASQSQRIVKITLNVKPSNVAVAVQDNSTPQPARKRSRRSAGRERSKDKKSSVGKTYGKTMAAIESEPVQAYPAGYPIYSDHGLPYYRIKPGAEWYRHDQLIEMVQKSLAENLSFQNPR